MRRFICLITLLFFAGAAAVPGWTQDPESTATLDERLLQLERDLARLDTLVQARTGTSGPQDRTSRDLDLNLRLGELERRIQQLDRRIGDIERQLGDAMRQARQASSDARTAQQIANDALLRSR